MARYLSVCRYGVLTAALLLICSSFAFGFACQHRCKVITFWKQNDGGSGSGCYKYEMPNAFWAPGGVGRIWCQNGIDADSSATSVQLKKFQCSSCINPYDDMPRPAEASDSVNCEEVGNTFKYTCPTPK